MTPTLEQSQLCTGITFFHTDDTRLHPVAIRNRKTGRIAYNLARPGNDSHHREAAVEVVDPDAVARTIVDQRMKARCQAVNGDHKGQFSPDGRNIVRIELN
jgi:hypothetical protein